MGKYRVSYDDKASSIVMELSGYFTDDDAINFVHDFIHLSNKCKTDETNLILDSGLLFIYPCYIRDKLSEIFKLYKDLGYKLVRFKVFKAQKEMVRKVKELCIQYDLNYDIFIIDL